uniref:Ig-like domain-containing protein n=1 Tax=Myripristis murdjan TaxID=586833 RepID=A0A667YP27_9TELE
MLCALSPDGFKYYMVGRCDFNSSELKDIEFIYSYYYNKDEIISNTTAGTSNTTAGTSNTTAGTSNETAGTSNTTAGTSNTTAVQSLMTTLPPSDVRLRLVTPPGGKHTHMLMCSVYGFYPKLISVKWLRDGKVTTSDVTSTEELADGDWYYQIHSYLEFTPRSGEKISCMVEHISLSDPLIRDWDPSLPESERNKIAIGASVLILGLILSLAGFIYYKRKMQGQSARPFKPVCPSQ